MSTDFKEIRREIHVQTRIIDKERGVCQYVASDESVDSYGEVVLASGWQFNRFQKNAPFVDSHDYSSLAKLVGKVLDFTVQNDANGNPQLIETVQWAIDVKGNQLAQLGWDMTVGGYLKAVSVGFFPVAAVSCYDGNTSAFQNLCAQKGLDPTKVRTIYTKQEQIELSACIIGANPNALGKSIKDALRDGAITMRQVESLFLEPNEQNAPAAQASGRAADASRIRARKWFLAEIERA